MKLKKFYKKFFNRKYLISQISGKVFFKYNPDEISKIDLIRKQFFNLNIDLNKNKFSKFIFMDKENASVVLKYKLNNIIFQKIIELHIIFLIKYIPHFQKNIHQIFFTSMRRAIAFAKKKNKTRCFNFKVQNLFHYNNFK